MRLSFSFRIFSCAAILAVLMVVGCRNKPEGHRTRVLKGRVTQIDLASGVVGGRFWNDKAKDYQDLKGKLAPDAEIMIDGRTARLEDVRVDDAVEVTGWEEKHDGEPRLIAKRVEVTRLGATTQPAGATRPATGPTGR